VFSQGRRESVTAVSKGVQAEFVRVCEARLQMGVHDSMLRIYAFLRSLLQTSTASRSPTRFRTRKVCLYLHMRMVMET
jgi:hypothetical protein